MREEKERREEEEQEEGVEGRGGERNERLQFAYHFISYGSLKVTDSSCQ